MISQTKRNGILGEVLAARALREAGYDVIDANFRTRLGEIDIIAAKDDVLAFCEVKTRQPHGKGLPREAVDRNKQRRLVAAALQYVNNRHYTGVYRFDVIEVYLHPNGKYTVEHIPHAFDGEDAGIRG